MRLYSQTKTQLTVWCLLAGQQVLPPPVKCTFWCPAWCRLARRRPWSSGCIYSRRLILGLRRAQISELCFTPATSDPRAELPQAGYQKLYSTSDPISWILRVPSPLDLWARSLPSWHRQLPRWRAIIEAKPIICWRLETAFAPLNAKFLYSK